MAEIVAFSAPMLKQAGLRKRRHSFNRRTTAGLVHVVSFWQAPKEPPAWTEVPGSANAGLGSLPQLAPELDAHPEGRAMIEAQMVRGCEDLFRRESARQ